MGQDAQVARLQTSRTLQEGHRADYHPARSVHQTPTPNTRVCWTTRSSGTAPSRSSDPYGRCSPSPMTSSRKPCRAGRLASSTGTPSTTPPRTRNARRRAVDARKRLPPRLTQEWHRGHRAGPQSPRRGLRSLGRGGELVTDRKHQPLPDPSLRDTDNVPLDEDIHEYFEREMRPWAADALIDETKSKVGYEIPFTRVFYRLNAAATSG